jgi:hypothetical protein
MIRPTFPTRAAITGTVFALLFAACHKPEIRVYTVAKEPPAAAEPKAAESPAETSTNSGSPKPQAHGHLEYQTPAGWKDVGASQFSLVNFRIPTPDGDAMVNVTPLSGMAGRDPIIVNMWRQQIGQPPLDDGAADASLKPVEIGGEQGKLFEVSGTQDGKPLRIITAFVHRPDGSWFYKLQGTDGAVASQKDAFINFLKTVKVAPEGWESQAPGQMQVAKFTVSKDGGKADISVSVFASDTGGTLANVNRWRRQLGLNETDEAGLQECVTPLGAATIDGAPGPVLADLSNDNRRMLGAIVPREGHWWFYKMLGDAPVVNAEHDTFVQFVKSQP